MRLQSLLIIFLLFIQQSFVLADRGIQRLESGNQVQFNRTALFTPPQARIALVIGNANYISLNKTPNAKNDAIDMTQKLEALGFDVILETDAGQAQLEHQIDVFMERLSDSGKDAVGLFYYAGHGVEVSGENYLIPVGENIRNVRQLHDKAMPLSRVLRGFSRMGNHNGSNFLILDACRNNPLGSGWSKPSDTSSVKNISWFFGTGYGKKASDNQQGQNGLFTKYLLKHLASKGATSEQVFKQVTAAVAYESSNAQIPEVGGSPVNDFMFYPGKRIIIKTTYEGMALWKKMSLYGAIFLLLGLTVYYYLHKRKMSWVHGIDLTRDLNIDREAAEPIIKRSRLATDEIKGYLKSLNDKKIAAIIPSTFPLTLGRNNNTNVVINRDVVSGEHAMIGWDKNANSFWIKDLDSANGIWWGPDKPLTPNVKYPLESGKLFYLSDRLSPYVIIAHKSEA